VKKVMDEQRSEGWVTEGELKMFVEDLIEQRALRKKWKELIMQRNKSDIIGDQVQTELRTREVADNIGTNDSNNIVSQESDTLVRNEKETSSATGTIEIFLKRNDKEVFINQYNETIIRAWQANMDIQFVTNAQAVIRYILDYMCKPEHELGDTMKAAMKDLPQNCAPRERLKKLGNVFMNARVLSAQEAAMRAIGLPLINLSRTVVFINTNRPANCMRILKSRVELN